MTTSDAAKKKAAAAKTQPATDEVIAADAGVAEQGAGPTDRRDPPADQQPGIDGASGALITGEDAEGRPLTTEDVAAGAEPVTPGRSKDPDKHDEDEDEKRAGPVKTTEVTWNGMTAHDTIDGVAQPPRPATLEEQLPLVAQDLLSLVVGSVPYATSGSIDLDGSTVTITLVSH